MAYSVLLAGIDFDEVRKRAAESGWVAENTQKAEELRKLFSKPGWPGLKISGLSQVQSGVVTSAESLIPWLAVLATIVFLAIIKERA